MGTSKAIQIVKTPVAVQMVERRIYLIRELKVMLDSDLAELYQVPTKRLNEQVRRNRNRFPPDFMFRLTPAEVQNLRSQIATSSWGGRRTAPFAFTEHGIAMLSSILASDRAVKMSITIIRAFVKLREFLASHKELTAKVRQIESAQKRHESLIGILVEEVQDLKRLPEPPPRRRIGFPPPK